MTHARRTVSNFILGAAFAAAALTHGLSAPPAPPAGPELRGRVVGDGGAPVSRATARILPEGKSATLAVETGADGTFLAQGLEGEVFRLRIEAKGYAALTESQIPANASVQLRLKRGHALAGTVLDRATRKPVAGAAVAVWDKDAEAFGPDAYRKTTSAKDGRFAVEDLPQGRVTIEIKAAGHATARSGNVSLPRLLPGGKPAQLLELLLDPAGSVTGRVTDTAEAPVAGAEVSIFGRDAAGSRWRKATTGPDGAYRIAEAADIVVRRMTVRAAGFPVAEREGPAPSDGVVDFVLERAGSISGRVRSPEGKPVPGFHLNVRRDTGAPESRAGENGNPPARDFADPSGAFRVDDLPPGTYTIEVTADPYAKLAKGKVDVLGERIVDVGTLTLEPRSTLRGRVLAAKDESPVAGAAVRVSLIETATGGARPGDADVWTETSSADGSFAIRGLRPGSFDLVAEHPGFAAARMRVTFDLDGDRPDLTVALHRGGTLTGTVVDAREVPVAGARIVASPGPDGEARVADTGPDGRYVIEGLYPGSYQVRRQGDGRTPSFGASSRAAVIREDETTTVDFDERPRILLSGTVLQGGAPLVNTSIFVFAIDGESGNDAKTTQTDGQGAFRLGLNHGGRYRASVRMGEPGGPVGQSVVTLTIPDQPEVHQDIVFTSNAIIGHVVGADGKELKGALVLAVREGSARGDTPRQATAASRDDGSFRLDGVDPGTYRVTARATGYAPGEVYPVVVGETNPEPSVDITLDRGWIARGRVVDPEGKPVTDAIIVVAPPGAAESGFLPSHTDATGAFKITAPSDGPVSVGAISARWAPVVQADVGPPSGDGAPDVVLHATAGGSLRVRIVHRGGGPAAGVQITFAPLPLFPGADFVVDNNRPRPTDADGTTVLTRLLPGEYVISIVGRRDIAPLPAAVSEGAEAAVQFDIP